MSNQETGKRKKEKWCYFYAQTSDYFMTSEKLSGHLLLRFLTCNGVCSRLDLSVDLISFLWKMANKNNYIKNSNILTVELSIDNEDDSREYN